MDVGVCTLPGIRYDELDGFGSKNSTRIMGDIWDMMAIFTAFS